MMYVRTAVTAALLSIAALAHASTDRDRWLAKLDDRAVVIGTSRDATIVDAFAHAKAACVCAEEGSLARRPGYVTVGEGADGLIAICGIPIFDENGALEGAAGCQRFYPLAK